MINHRILRLVIAFAAGLAVSFYAYQRVTDPEPRRQRLQEESVVFEARARLRELVAPGGQLEIVDPVATDRDVGKVYIYPTEWGWQVSGHYRRPGETDWHPWLMSLGMDRSLRSLAVQDSDPALIERARGEDRLTVKP